MTNSSDRREYFRQYRQRHKNDEKYKADARARGIKYRKLHTEHNQEDRREYYRQYRQRKGNDPEYTAKQRERVARYRQNNPDKIKDNARKRSRATNPALIGR